MLVVPTILISLLPAIAVALILTKWIRRGLRMPDIAPVQLGAWTESIDWQSINWRLVGGIAAAILLLVGAKGLGSYFYVTENGVSVRPPLEFTMRHYEWKDVAAISVRCRLAPRTSRFRYTLEMSDGYEVDVSRAIGGTTANLRAASAARFAESIPPHLNRVPGIRYKFDVSQDGLASHGRRRGVVLSNALREQVLAHGGTLQ
ncbi:MAG: hypothetical protein ACREVT_05675 [Burkholderiales bacterium]